MTEIDFDRLGDVWREQLDPAEMARLQRTAADVAKRARFAHFVDIGAAIVVGAVVILLVFTNPRAETVLMGSAAIFALLGSNIRQRKLRQVELKSLTGGTEEMLEQSIERVETTLRHNRFSLIALGPFILIGFLFASTSRGGSALVPALRDGLTVRVLWIGLTIAAIAGIALFLVRAIRRTRRELERLHAMRDSYRQERESTTS